MSTAVATTKRMGRFKLVRELGRGAQGTVYLADDPHLQRQVALKTLHRGVAQEDLAALLDEARAVSRLAHPNIVKLFDVPQDRNEPFLVFEYVCGTPLSQSIKSEGRIPAARAVQIALGMARGLAFAHTEQVVHRDIKPANVLIAADGVPRLMDFGIARRGASGPEADYRGTPAYMAPEYIDTRTFTPACDVFAVGVVLYEMLTGLPPVSNASAFATFTRIVNEPIKPPSTLSPDLDVRLDAIVLKALAKHPAARYDGAASLANELSAYLERDPHKADSGGATTVELLLERLRHKGDFPALGGTLSSIHRIVGTETEHTSVLANAILKDVSMTNRLLVLSFLHDEAQAIARLVANQSHDEAGAAHAVLGIGVEELGSAIATSWNFPDPIIDAMQAPGERPTAMPASMDQRTRLLAEVSNDLADVARLTDERDRSTRLAAMTRRYAAVGIGPQALGGALPDRLWVRRGFLRARGLQHPARWRPYRLARRRGAWQRSFDRGHRG